MSTDWKSEIISLTELPRAREHKIDASFFPAVSENHLLKWERENDLSLPEEMRSFLLQSDGLEASRGEFWPVLPLRQWDVIRDECSSPTPWLRFGEGREHRYLLSTGHSPSIYRHETFGSNEEFFASSFRGYLKKVFQNEA
jgi:hypothetical protein